MPGCQNTCSALGRAGPAGLVTDASVRPPGRVGAYARTLAARLTAMPDGVLRAAYLHGSAALGGWVPRRAILEYLAGELGWGLEHAPEAYVVLNACRALIYLADSLIVSKITGGETVLSHGAGPAAVIERALAQQRGSKPDRPPAPAAVSFVRETAAMLRSAAADEPAG